MNVVVMISKSTFTFELGGPLPLHHSKEILGPCRSPQNFKLKYVRKGLCLFGEKLPEIWQPIRANFAKVNPPTAAGKEREESSSSID